MSANDRKPREAWLDGVKGIAILLVILGHVLSGYLDAGTFPEAYDSFYPVRTWIYSFHMPLFFLVSGFTFTLAYWRETGISWRKYLRQMGSLLWLYAVFALIQWGVKQAVPDLVNEAYDMTDLRRMFLEPLGNFWYLYVLFVIYLIAAVTHLGSWRPWWLLMPGALAVMAADLHLDWTNLTLYRILYHFFFFAVGSALCRRRWILDSPKVLGLTGIGLSLVAYFYFFCGIRNWYANWKLGIALATCFAFLAVFRHWRPLAELKLFQVCGKHCLEIYLLHTFFTAGFRALLPLAGIRTPWLSVWVNFLLSTLVCLGIAFLAARARWTDVLFRPARFLRRLLPEKT